MEKAVGGVEVRMMIVCLILLIVHSRSIYAKNTTEAYYLLAFMNELEGSMTTLSSWKYDSPKAPCDWDRIHCHDDGLLSSISLGNVGIGGPINGDLLSLFSKLNHLNLSHNHMTGSIPEAFGNMNFTRLILNNNHIDGSIPCSLGLKYEILYIDLSSNHLGGCVPQHLVNNKNDFYYGDNPGMTGYCTNCYFAY